MRRRWIVVLILCGLPSVLWAEPLTLAWDAPTTNSDASPLTDLSHYLVRWGTSTGVYTGGIVLGNVTQITIKGLNPSQVYFFVVYAVDTSGHESVPSNEISGRPTLILHH